ncbi:MAG TPA: hypothetical protein V6C86_19700 [Oculatellaceae cyanobacterium]
MAKVNPWKVTGYKAGQNVVCKVSHAEPGGYAVIIPKDNLPGFLPTEQQLKPGEEVLAQYVCVSNSRILLQCRFGTNTKPGGARQSTVNWEEQLDQIDQRPAANVDYSRPQETAGQDYGENNGQNYQDQYASNYSEQQDYSQQDYAQQSYQSDAYASDQYAQSYAETQNSYSQPAANQWQSSDFSQNAFGQPQSGDQSYQQSQQNYNQQPEQGGYHQSYQGVQDQGAYGQNMQFTPQNAATQIPTGFGGSSGGMQFKPQLPADYAEAENQWSTQSIPPQSNPPYAAPPVTPSAPAAPANNYQDPFQPTIQGGNPFQASQVQAPAQPPVAFQPSPASPPPAGAPSPFQTANQGTVSGSYQTTPASVQPAQAPFQPPANQYSSGGQPAAYQAPTPPVQYQPPQLAQQAPPPAPTPPPPPPPLPTPSSPLVQAEPLAPSAKKPASEDDWGYSGQGWDDDNRLTSPAPTPSLASEADAAFRVWAPQAHPREFHLKRATDLVPPAFDPSSLATFTAEEQDLEWLITDIEGGMRTGCVKAVSQSSMSRSAALLYKGRAVGCIYGRKQQPENYGTEQSLQIMMQDLEKPDTEVQLYDLPENIVLPMSALFLGYPVPREEKVDARTYMDYMCNWFASKTQTACLAITFPSRSATCLCFIFEGTFCGAFYVEEQKFTPDKEFVYQLMQTDPQASVEANILPPEMTSSAVRFGFNLSMARKKGY